VNDEDLLSAIESMRARNFKEAYQQFVKLSEAKHSKLSPIANHFLAWMHEQGLGTNLSKEAAFELWLENARNGMVSSQEAAADCYNTGEGVEKNIVNAYAWYKIALLGEDRDGLSNSIDSKVRMLKSVLDATNIEAAQEIIDLYMGQNNPTPS